MKTPWKFIARLTSRRPPAEAQGSSIGDDNEPKDLEREVDSSTHPASSTVAASPLAHDEDGSADQGSLASDNAKGHGDAAHALKSLIDAEGARTTARDEAGQSDDEAKSLIPENPASAKSQSKPRLKRRGREKRADARVAGRSAVAPKHQSSQPSSSRDVFYQEVGTLDEEIKMLRTQLAEKLHLQNVQLKKMLERFDIS